MLAPGGARETARDENSERRRLAAAVSTRGARVLIATAINLCRRAAAAVATSVARAIFARRVGAGLSSALDDLLRSVDVLAHVAQS